MLFTIQVVYIIVVFNVVTATGFSSIVSLLLYHDYSYKLLPTSYFSMVIYKWSLSYDRFLMDDILVWSISLLLSLHMGLGWKKNI